MHGWPAGLVDVLNIMQWGPAVEPVKAELNALSTNDRKARQLKYDKAALIAEFLAKRLAAGDSAYFTFRDFAVWNDGRTKPRNTAQPAAKFDDLSADQKARRQKSWGSNGVGAFSTCFRLFPCRTVSDGHNVGLAVVPVGGYVESAPKYCVVFQFSVEKPAYAGPPEPSDATLSEQQLLQGALPTFASIEPKTPKVPAPDEEPRPQYPCVPPWAIGGTERDKEWLLNAISFIDGMTGGPHGHHLGESNPDVHQPDVLKAARNKLEFEDLGYRFLIEDHTPVGYASLWRVSLQYCNDLYGWIKGTGTMKHDKAELKMEPWNPSLPPKVWLGYVSSLRIHPRVRYNPKDPEGLGARDALFRGVVKMLEEYALRGHIFAELIAWTSHVHERDFLRNLRGDHPLEAGENNNIVRLRLSALPLKGRPFKNLNSLYQPHAALLAEAAERLRRQQGPATLFSVHDGK